MRPPMSMPVQTAALQQNEIAIGNRHHLHQSLQASTAPIEHLTTATATATATSTATATITTTTGNHSHATQRQTKLQQSHSDHHSTTATSLPGALPVPSATSPAATVYQRSPLDFIEDNDCIDSSTVQLLDLSTSPPSAADSYAPTYRQQQQRSVNSRYRAITATSTLTSDSEPPPTPANRSTTTVISNGGSGGYSRSSTTSSEDDASLSLSHSFSGGGANTPYSRASTFEDAAENFIIDFPGGDSSPTRDCVINLPLSETEPLLTNIEVTGEKRHRSLLSLSKNSASLIFTKKDWQPEQANNNFSSTNHQQRRNSATSTHRPLHYSLRERNEHSAGRKSTTKHLPATYQQQQQRRSLQLNYNNNLVTTSSCGAAGNNNYCCSTGGSGGLGAVLHKHTKHHRHSSVASTPSAAAVAAAAHPSLPPVKASAAATTTAAVTRKQHAYSWYAPVYSALEEELEQDSRDSSPIHNLANTKKQHSNRFQHRSSYQTSSSSSPSSAVDNETVALLESRNQINIQAQLHVQSQHQHKDSAAAAAAAAASDNSNSNGGGSGGGGGDGFGGGGVLSFHPKRSKSTGQAPNSLPLKHSLNVPSAGAAFGVGISPTNGVDTVSSGGGGGGSGSGDGGDYQNVEDVVYHHSDGIEGPLASSLGLAGGPGGRRKRFENFLNFLKGLRPSNGRNISSTSASGGGGGDGSGSGDIQHLPLPGSPEIKITRAPSDQNVVVLRDPAGRQQHRQRGSSTGGGGYKSSEKLANGSTSSLNVVQQKLWNMMRREDSASSLYQEKSQSIVQYTAGLRKCETVLALTRQNSVCSPGSGLGHGPPAGNGSAVYTGSGIFSASGVEQIRPLNRLRNSMASVNATCSRCSSLLSLAATGSRYSLNVAANGGAGGGFVHSMPTSASQHHLHAQLHSQRNPSRNISSGNLNAAIGRSRDCVDGPGVMAMPRTVSESEATRTAPMVRCRSSSGNCSRKCSVGAQSSLSTVTDSSICLPSNVTTATMNTALTPTSPRSPITTDSLGTPTALAPPSLALAATSSSSSPAAAAAGTLTPTASTTSASAPFKTSPPPLSPPTTSSEILVNLISAAPPHHPQSSTSSSTTVIVNSSPLAIHQKSKTADAADTGGNGIDGGGVSDAAEAGPPGPVQGSSTSISTSTSVSPSSVNTVKSSTTAAAPQSSRPFQMFTCKLCLVDVETAGEATTLQQCGCQFCTECMRAYVEFEISEAAYEISCPDAQCPAQGIMSIGEIAALTTANLMKKHHRYRLNREIELDKTRTWCPRAGCETICLVGPGADATPSTSSAFSQSNSLTVTGSPMGGIFGGPQILCGVQCPSCKDEFCSACKKAWHPNISCEENSRRLVADGQDDIGIPFDNDLIKCCPMCAVPIEKDEGCAQMMCKRCKHVFCWYCLASLDDDFLLRHYDKGPCKNKLGHSRASVVWHRAQVIGIFAGFGILLLVASPLLLLAAPCIICCKCRSCSSKMDDADGDLDEATALQSL